MFIVNGKLSLTNKEAVMLLKDMSVSIRKLYRYEDDSRHLPFNIKFLSNEVDSSVSINIGRNMVPDIRIGTYGIDFNPFHGNREVDMMAFMRTVSSLFHEEQHVYQVVESMHHQDEDGVILAMEHLSTQGNHDFFYINNYAHNCMEIDANYNAIFSLYDYLQSTFPGIDAEQYTLDYIDYKRKMVRDYCINPRNGDFFVSLDEVDAAFKDAYENGKHCRKFLRWQGPADVELSNRYGHTNYRPDEVMNFWYKHDMRMCSFAFDSESDGFKQRLMVASTVLGLHPEYKACYDSFNPYAIKSRNTFGFWLPGERTYPGFDTMLTLDDFLVGSAKSRWKISEEAKQFWPVLRMKCLVPDENCSNVLGKPYARITALQKSDGHEMLKPVKSNTRNEWVLPKKSLFSPKNRKSDLKSILATMEDDSNQKDDFDIQF